MPIRLAFTLILLLFPALGLSGSRTAHPTPAATWPQSTPEAQGMSSLELAAMLERIAESNPGIRSLMVIRHGQVVLDARIAPFQRGDRQDIHSCTKSVLSALVGIAIARGDLPGTDTPVLEFLSEHDFAHLDEEKHELTLDHLLTMSAGLQTEDSYLYGWTGLRRMHESDDRARYILGLPLVAEPGSRFEYSNCVSQLISIIFHEATGMSAAAYARKHLFGPLGIEEFEWGGSDPEGSWGYTGLSMLPRDMARIGYLYLHEGKWGGSQVVPADWVRRSTTARIGAGTMADSYGYQWWVEGELFMMIGYGGQFVYVLPKLDLVAVFTGSLQRGQFFTPRSLFGDYIEAAVVDDDPLAENRAGTAKLDSLLQLLAGGEREAALEPQALPPSISGKTFEFEANRIGFSSCTLSFTPGSPEAELAFVVSGVSQRLTVGLDGRYRFTDLNDQRWACRGAWENDDTFVMDQECVGKVLRRVARLSFQDKALSFEVRDQVRGTVELYHGRETATGQVDSIPDRRRETRGGPGNDEKGNQSSP